MKNHLIGGSQGYRSRPVWTWPGRAGQLMCDALGVGAEPRAIPRTQAADARHYVNLDGLEKTSRVTKAT